MLTELQAKMAVFFGGLVILLVSNLGSYLYGHSVGVELQQGKQAKVEVARVSNVTAAVIKNSGQVVAGVAADNEKERKANERYETAMAELSKSRAANRQLIADHGGLRISSDACAGRVHPAGEAEAPGSSVGDGSLTGTIALPEQIESDLQDSADEADVILERLRTLQEWVREQGFY